MTQLDNPTEVTSVPTFTGSIRIRLRTKARFRTMELGLLAVACGINAVTIVLVQFGVNGAVDWSLGLLGLGLSVLVFAMHIALRVVAPNADPFLLPIATLLNGLGIAMIYRLDLAKGYTGWDMAGVRQIVWSGLAIILAILVVTLLRNHRVLQRYRFTFMVAGAVLLLLPMLPIFSPINGAQVWIQIGSFSFQSWLCD